MFSKLDRYMSNSINLILMIFKSINLMSMNFKSINLKLVVTF